MRGGGRAPARHRAQGAGLRAQLRARQQPAAGGSLLARISPAAPENKKARRMTSFFYCRRHARGHPPLLGRLSGPGSYEAAIRQPWP
ncbi:hypothetical protein CBM2626_A200079 [Cupriavidus taiwanensis]|nr:hypothetical protein CBM2626_A200079 [Cupriavidus taiwanensis]